MAKYESAYPLNRLSSEFLAIKGHNDLALLLGEYVFDLYKIIRTPIYTQFNIPKKSGGKRIVFCPDKKLLLIQKRLNVYLQGVFYNFSPQSSHGFIVSTQKDKPKGIISNAKNHINKNYVLNIDLKDFFHSISAKRIKNLFLSAPFSFSEDVAKTLALLCCYQKKLPAGCPTSPILSNMVCYQMDMTFENYCIENKLVYTRYADDLSFSSTLPFTESQINEIRKIIRENAFEINEKKTRIQSKYTKQEVTGLTVNTKLNVDRKYIRNIRAILFDWNKNGIENALKKHYQKKGKILLPSTHTFISSINGKIEFIGSVKGKDDSSYLTLKENFENLILFAS